MLTSKHTNKPMKRFCWKHLPRTARLCQCE